MMRRLALLLGITFSVLLIGCTTAGPSVDDSILDLGGDEAPMDTAASGEANQGIDEFSGEDFADDFSGDQAVTEKGSPDSPVEDFALEPSEPTEEYPAPTIESQDLGGAVADAFAPQDASALAEVTNIKYLANQSGGSVVIETSRPAQYQLRNKPETKQFVIEVSGVKLPDRLKRPYIMKEFDAAFAGINAYQNPGSDVARVVVQLKSAESGEPVVSQEGSTIVIIPASTAASDLPVAQTEESTKIEEEPSIDIKKAEQDEKALGAQSLDQFVTGGMRFYGRPISIEVSNADIRDVMNFIAVESGINMILADEVQGKITLKLRGIPWDQALVTIMKAKKLGYIRQGNVVRIATLGALQEETDAAKRILEAQKVLAPLRVKVIPVSYASVDELQGRITPFLTAGRGQMVNDPRTSSLIITDTEDVLERVSRLIKELDIPPAQVMIEGKVVEALESFSQTLGLNWNFTGSPIQLSKSGGFNKGPINLTPQLFINNLDPGSTLGNILGTGVSVGTLEFFGNINAALGMAERDEALKVLSSPRVVTMNKEKASIQQKGEVVTVSTSFDPQTRVTNRTSSAKAFSLELNVTPQITADGSVIMEVDVKREFPGAIVDPQTNARPINTRQAKTRILVRDGQTAVIGGIYSADNTTQENGVPLLKDIPVLGWLFKSRVRSDIRNELLIFLTPKILNVKDQAAEG